MGTRVKVYACIAAALAAWGAAHAAGAALVKPAYPASVLTKPLEVNVVARATLDAAGKAAATEVAYNDGPAPFAAAAASALAATAFEPGRNEAFVWYTYRLAQETLAEDITPGREAAPETPPELVTAVAPEFPPGAPSLRPEVALELLVGKNGRVWFARAPRDGADPLYVERALAAARLYIFTPATRGGKTVPAWYQFVMDFS